MSAKRIAIGLAGVFVVAAGAAFFTFFERYSEEVDLGWSPEAQRNPFLAAEQFLQDSSIATRRADNISVVAELGPEDTLLLASSRQVYNSDRVDELLAWVSSGGHAIVIAQNTFDDERDWLLETLDTTVVKGDGIVEFEGMLKDLLGDEFELDEEPKSAGELAREYNRRLDERAKSENVAEAASSDEPATQPREPDVDAEDLVTLSDHSERDYVLHFNPRHLLWHPTFDDEQAAFEPTYWTTIESQDNGVPLLQFEHGEGLVTLMADQKLWQSERIGQFDHAYFLWEMASYGEFVLITRPHFASLGELANRYVREFLLAGGICLLAWLLLRSRRFGPTRPTPETGRRSLTEHISASGQYYWRSDHCADALRSITEPLLRRLGLHSHALANDADNGKRSQICRRLSALTGIKETTIAESLWGPAPESEEAFTERMRNLQRIEAAL